MDGERADLVVMKSEAQPFLVIETKKRVKVQPGKSCARKTVKAKNYADKLGAPYYAICNGWTFLLFSRGEWSYLIGAYGVETNNDFARNLLLGFLNQKYLNSLPDVPDPYELEKRVLPFIAKTFAPFAEPESLLKKWISRIKTKHKF